MIENQRPLVSIVIPTFNEEQYLSECLSSIQRLDYPKDLIEVILVDNGSTDRTLEIAKSFDITVVVKTGVKVGGVRNYGAHLAQGDIYAFIDGDCVAPTNWLDAAINKLADNAIGGVGGAYLLRDNPSWVETGWVLEQEKKTEESTSLVGGSFIVKAPIFNDIGGFDEHINAGEDTKLAKAISKTHQVWKVAECAVIHLGYPNTISGFCRRQFWHASSYRKSNLGLLKDKVYFLVVLFTLSFISLALCLLIKSEAFLYCSIFLVLSPLIFSLNRIGKVGFSSTTIKRLPYVLLLDFFYFASRSAGLVTSYFYDPYKKK